jgi:hypothetical protein
MANLLTRFFGSKEKEKNVGSTIIPEGLQRTKQDVGKWREAILEAEQAYNPFRVKMQNGYSDTVLNGHVSACMEYRKNLTLLRDFEIEVDEEEVEGLEEIFETKWFSDLVNYILDAKFFGYSLISLGDVVNGSFNELTLIKRQNISPDRLNASPYVYGLTGANFTEEPYKKWHIYASTPSDNGYSRCGYGLLYKVAMYEILCRNLIGYNSDSAEIFGMPLRVGKTYKTDETERQEFADALSFMGSAGWMVTDMNEEIEFISNSQSGSGFMIYENLEVRCEKKISKILLGHADALDSVAGKLGNDSAESPAQKAISDIQTLDGKYVENIVNEQLIPNLRSIGFAIPESACFKYSNSSEEMENKMHEIDMNTKLSAIAQNMKNAGLQMDAKYFEEQTGITTKPVMFMPSSMPSSIPLPNPLSNRVTNKLNEIYK